MTRWDLRAAYRRSKNRCGVHFEIIMNKSQMTNLKRHIPRIFSLLLLIMVIQSCGVTNKVLSPDICSCLPLEPDALDYRHAAKHVPLPSGTPQEIDVNTILTWAQTPVLPPDQPRTGRELQLMHIATAYLENASLNTGDCDIHLEISQTPDKNAPRVVVETPVDSEYCAARQNLQKQLKQQGFQLDAQHGGELPQPLRVNALGLPFEDFEHGRGSPEVATLWEIHPAIVNLY